MLDTMDGDIPGSVKGRGTVSFSIRIYAGRRRTPCGLALAFLVVAG
jgi:hypothetical protein